MGVGAGEVGPGISAPSPGGSSGPTPPGSGITSGSLPTLTSIQLTTGVQVDATSDRFLVVTANTAGTLLVALSPDNVTYSTVDGVAVPVSGNAGVGVYVPKGWWAKVTLITSVITSATYW